ncbi:TPA: hypothetical protein NJL49_002635 [Pseudomonas aeruginosa]|nr:hypothetical protein [Pseudomonas aeruginosa]HCG1358678.1 hypothetical protein [Pseudomonas aeruginosa]HCG1472629.1 hypothetical protein [Pseudomonas aeruginosa]HCG1489758.1 hypothetical protein [Pseudomonas aeruginosa]
MIDGADWTTILVAFSSGATAALGPVALSLWSEAKSKSAVRAAILAEVAAIADVIRHRRYVEDLYQIERNVVPARQAQMQVVVPDEVTLIYRSNADKLGSLSPNEAARVVCFYQMVLSVAADMAPGGAVYEGPDQPRTFAESRLMLLKALSIADELAGV